MWLKDPTLNAIRNVKTTDGVTKTKYANVRRATWANTARRHCAIRNA